MTTIDVRVNGADEFIRALKRIQKELPQEAYKMLDDEAEKFETEISDAYPRAGVHSTTLKDSFNHKESLRQRQASFVNKFEVKVKSDVPHDHLIEYGHDLVTHKPSKKKIGEVKAYGPVQNAIDVFNDGHHERVARWLQKTIEEGIK